MKTCVIYATPVAAQQAHAADRLIEASIVADLGFLSHWFLLGALYHPAAADAGR